MLYSEDCSDLTQLGSYELQSFIVRHETFHLDNVNGNSARIGITLRDMNIHLVKVM